MAKLTFETWRQWKADLESLLSSQGCKTVVKPTPPKDWPGQDSSLNEQPTQEETDAKAKHIIVTSLGDHWIAYDVKTLATARDMWTYLVDFFEGKGIERKRRRWYAFQDVRLEPGQSAKDFVGVYVTALEEAVEAGCKLDDETQVFDFIHRVGQQFPHFKLNQEMKIDAADKVPELRQLLGDFTDFTTEHGREVEKKNSS